MTASIWDDPEIRTNDDYIKFDIVGDTVTGRILAIKAHRFDDGKVVPQLLLDVDGDEKTLTAGQVRLKAELAELRPETGDTLTVTLTEIEKRAGGKTLKHFTVAVNQAATTPVAVAPTPAPVAEVAVDTQAAAAAIANLTPEQKAALGIA